MGFSSGLERWPQRRYVTGPERADPGAPPGRGDSNRHGRARGTVAAAARHAADAAGLGRRRRASAPLRTGRGRPGAGSATVRGGRGVIGVRSARLCGRRTCYPWQRILGRDLFRYAGIRRRNEFTLRNVHKPGTRHSGPGPSCDNLPPGRRLEQAATTQPSGSAATGLACCSQAEVAPELAVLGHAAAANSLSTSSVIGDPAPGATVLVAFCSSRRPGAGQAASADRSSGGCSLQDGCAAGIGHSRR
jgi:hypothetical protein